MRILITTLMLIFVVQGSFTFLNAQQDTRYSQFMMNGMRFNPAYSGAKENLNITAFYRNQWLQIEDSPKQLFVGINDAFGKKEKVGLGLMIENDQIGVDQRTNVFASYAYKIDLAEGRLSAGIQGGASFFNSNLTKIETPEGGDDSSFRNDEQSITPNFGAGLLYYSENYYLGFSVPHLLSYQKKESDNHSVSRLRGNYREYIFTMGGNIVLRPDVLDFRPAILVQYIPAEAPIEVDINASIVVKDAAWFGVTYRSNEIAKAESINFQFAYKMDNGLKVGYAYDHTLKSLGSQVGGSHEIMISFDLKSELSKYTKTLF